MNDQPYTVESPTRVKWTREADHWRREYGMSRIEFARYLLDRHHQGEGEVQHHEINVPGVPGVDVNVVNKHEG